MLNKTATIIKGPNVKVSVAGRPRKQASNRQHHPTRASLVNYSGSLGGFRVRRPSRKSENDGKEGEGYRSQPQRTKADDLGTAGFVWVVSDTHNRSYRPILTRRPIWGDCRGAITACCFKSQHRMIRRSVAVIQKVSSDRRVRSGVSAEPPETSPCQGPAHNYADKGGD